MIKHVAITNYKSLGEVSVHLDPVTVLIGRSGAGKSNFIHALRFLRDYLSYRDDSFLQASGGWDPVMSATTSRPMTVSFGVHFDAPRVAEDYNYLLTFWQPPGNPQHAPQFREERLSLGNRVLFHQDQGKWLHPPAMANPPKAGPLMLGALTGIPESTIAHWVLTKGLGCYAFPDSVLLRPGQNPKPNESGLADTGDNYLQAFQAMTSDPQTWHHPKDIAAALQSLNPSVKSVDLELPGRNRILVHRQIGEQPLVLDLSQESEGFRRLLAYLLALYQSPAKQTLLLDEPEKGLYPRGLAILAEEFKVCAAKGRGQVILTTHSPEFLDKFAPEQIRVVEMHDYVTRIGPVAPEQLEALREQFLQPGELLTVDEARLEGSLAATE
jgi:energy-coupling factor transporter ATP-binding protein EcfA2